MNAGFRTIEVIFAIILVILAGARAGAQASAEGQTADAQRIAELERQLQAVQQRLEALERKLEEKEAAPPASSGTIPDGMAEARVESSTMTATTAASPTSGVAPDAQSRVAAPANPFVGAGPEGFAIQSPEGDFRLGIRFQLHVDGRFAIDRNPEADPNTIYLRRVQPILSGRIYRRFNYTLLTDFSQGKVRVNDAWVNAAVSPALVVQVGKFKGPVGLERMRSGMGLPLMERALPTQLVPNRDVGVQFSGDLMRSRISYAMGVFDGVPDGETTDGNTDDHKEFNGRLMFQPFEKTSYTALQGLNFGVGGSYGEVQGTASLTQLAGYSSTGQFEFFRYRGDGTAAGTVVADGTHYRLSPQGYYYVGPFGVMTEFVQSVQDVRLGNSRAAINNSAWQVMTSYVLTGDDGTFAGVTPRRPFDPAQGNWGALELAARYSALTADREAFPLFADPGKRARRARAWSLALTWYLNRNLKSVFGYEQTEFDAAVPGVHFDAERLFQQRFQMRF